MKTRKAISYAYSTSTNAELLGHGSTGCYYVSTYIFREDGNWSTPSPVFNAEGFSSPTEPDLIASYLEASGEDCPLFLKYGNHKALNAIAQRRKEASTC